MWACSKTKADAVAFQCGLLDSLTCRTAGRMKRGWLLVSLQRVILGVEYQWGSSVAMLSPPFLAIHRMLLVPTHSVVCIYLFIMSSLLRVLLPSAAVLVLIV